MENYPFPQFPDFSRKEEIIHYITHGIAAVASLMGMIWLVQVAIKTDNNWVIAGFLTFGLVLTFCFASSSVYHFVEKSKLKARLRLIDHLAIYLLIAGTYTPFTLVNLRGNWGLSIFILVWTMALAGIIFKITIRKKLQKYEKVDALFYALMGCLGLLFFKPMVENIHIWGVLLLFGGGLFYLTGIIFYLKKNIPYHHAIWHLFVMAGAGMHFCAVLFYVVP